MGAPYSLDLRERVVAAVAAGLSREAAADRFSVSRSSVARWVVREAALGSAAASPMGGKKPFALAKYAAWIDERLAQKAGHHRPRVAGRASRQRRPSQLLWRLAFP